MALKLDMSAYQPYRPMGQSCELRDIKEFQISWPKIKMDDQMKVKNCSLRYMSAKDVDEVIELWKNVYPEVYGSTHQFVFDPKWYQNGKLLFAENWQKEAKEKQYAIIVMENQVDNRLIGVLLMTKWDQNLQIELTMGGFHSDYREKNMFYPFFISILDLIKTSEVELITVFAETWHHKSQELMDHNGFKIWGIFPGNMIRWTGDQKCYRACEVHYYKFVNGGEKYASQFDEWHLSERSEKLWRKMEELNE